MRHPKSEQEYHKERFVHPLSIIILLLILLICFGLWMNLDLLWPKNVYQLYPFDYSTIDERLAENLEKDIPLYIAVVPVSERKQDVAENYPYDYDIYAFQSGDDKFSKPFILASINDNLKDGGLDVIEAPTLSYEYSLREVFYSLADLTSEETPLYYMLDSTNEKDISCVIIGDTAYCLTELYADWAMEGGHEVGAFDIGDKKIATIKVAFR